MAVAGVGLDVGRRRRAAMSGIDVGRRRRASDLVSDKMSMSGSSVEVGSW